MSSRDPYFYGPAFNIPNKGGDNLKWIIAAVVVVVVVVVVAVSYTHLRAHETPEHLVCRLLLEKKAYQYAVLLTDGTVEKKRKANTKANDFQ